LPAFWSIIFDFRLESLKTLSIGCECKFEPSSVIEAFDNRPVASSLKFKIPKKLEPDPLEGQIDGGQKEHF
jgi:hypothetical protein